jgi:hypothetical protein
MATASAIAAGGRVGYRPHPAAGQGTAITLYGVSGAWAVGSTQTATGDYLGTVILRRSGSSWQRVASPEPGTTSSLNAVNGAWAVGQYNEGSTLSTLILHWNGTSWQQVPSPNPGVPNKGLTDNVLWGVSSTWAVGYYSSGAGNYKTLILRRSAAGWQQVPSPSPGTQDASLPSDDNALMSVDGSFAVGYYDNTHGADRTLILHWNGSSWQQVASPDPGVHGAIGLDELDSVDGAWAVGEYGTLTGLETLILHWNGLSWQQVPSPSPGKSANFLFSVNGSWAAGAYQPSESSPEKSLILHWSGSNWQVVPSPNPGIVASGTALYSIDAPWAVGTYDTSSKSMHPLVLHWSGSIWSESRVGHTGVAGAVAQAGGT